MADTVVYPNNRTIVFRGRAERERRMPAVSQSQARAMYAAAEGKSTLGIPAKVGREFTADQAPGSVKKLPKRVNKKARKLHAAGRISDKKLAQLERG